MSANQSEIYAKYLESAQDSPSSFKITNPTELPKIAEYLRKLREQNKELIEALEDFIKDVPDNAAFRVGSNVGKLRAILAKIT